MKIGMIFLVIVMASGFGGASGYLGAKFDPSWVTDFARAQEQPVIDQPGGGYRNANRQPKPTPANVTSYSLDSLEDRVARIEKALGKKPLEMVDYLESPDTPPRNDLFGKLVTTEDRVSRESVDARIRDIESQIGWPTGSIMGLDDRVSRLESKLSGY